jgi:tRNA 2-thiocytidine biosynthesis protein TtcA
MQRVADRLEKGLVGLVARASIDFDLIGEGDRVLVAVSGGKDSLSLLALLRLLRRRTPFPFGLAAVTVDQGQPAFQREKLARYFEAEGIDYQIIVEDTYSVVKQKTLPGTTACSLCSRLRRGILYTAAVRLGATKIALGHHRDDAIETLLLNIFYSGQLKAMPAKLMSDDGHNTIIRPLIYCSERELTEYAARRRLPVVSASACSQEPNLRREEMKQLIDRLQATNPHVRGNLLAALQNVRATHLLDRRFLRHPVGGQEQRPVKGEPDPEPTLPARQQQVEGSRVFWGASTPPTGARKP